MTADAAASTIRPVRIEDAARICAIYNYHVAATVITFEETPVSEAEMARRIRELDGWRSDTLARMRGLILEAEPEVTEEWKWDNPVWSHNGIICTGEAYKKAVKLTFARGASIPDPRGLFNSSLEGNTRRAIDIPEGENVDARAFKALVKAAVARNASAKRRP